MTVPLFEPATLGTYLLAAVALVVAPGPGQALVLARTLQGGTRQGVLTALGLELGTLVHTFAAALGLSAILATSAAAFAVVKWLGAGYLVWLGISAFRAAGKGHAAEASPPAPTHHVLLRAAITGLLNPKVALFFLAFLPQFVTPARGHVFLQFVILGLVFALIGLAGDSLLAVAAGRARTRLVGSTAGARWRERVTGAVLIGLGLRLALVQRG